MKSKNNIIISILFYGLIAFLVIYFLFFRHNQTSFSPSSDNITPTPTADIFIPTSTPFPTFSPVTQSYWYCWNVGNPSPHHLGHPVYGDHLCTNQELGR